MAALETDGVTQTELALKLKLLVGVGFTVTIAALTVDTQVGAPALATVKVIVLTPALFQESIAGPVPEGLPPIQPSQVQV
jgi:hypothetical protein